MALVKCWLLDPCRDLKYIQLFKSDSNSVTQSDNMYSNSRCIITLKTSRDTSLPTVLEKTAECHTNTSQHMTREELTVKPITANSEPVETFHFL